MTFIAFFSLPHIHVDLGGDDWKKKQLLLLKGHQWHCYCKRPVLCNIRWDGWKWPSWTLPLPCVFSRRCCCWGKEDDIPPFLRCNPHPHIPLLLHKMDVSLNRVTFRSCGSGKTLLSFPPSLLSYSCNCGSNDGKVRCDTMYIKDIKRINIK